MYIKKNEGKAAIYLPIDFHTFKGKAEESALVDSGATGNFIDSKTVQRLGLGTKALDVPRMLINLDGTENRSGRVSRYCDLMVTTNGKREQLRLYVSDLGRDRMIL